MPYKEGQMVNDAPIAATEGQHVTVVTSSTWAMVVQQLVTVALLVAGGCFVLVWGNSKELAGALFGAAGGIVYPIAMRMRGSVSAYLPLGMMVGGGLIAALWVSGCVPPAEWEAYLA